MVSPGVSLSLCPRAQPGSPQGRCLLPLWLWLLFQLPGSGLSSGERAGSALSCATLTYFSSSGEHMKDGRVLWHRVAPRVLPGPLA